MLIRLNSTDARNFEVLDPNTIACNRLREDRGSDRGSRDHKASPIAFVELRIAVSAEPGVSADDVGELAGAIGAEFAAGLQVPVQHLSPGRVVVEFLGTPLPRHGAR